MVYKKSEIVKVPTTLTMVLEAAARATMGLMNQEKSSREWQRSTFP